MGDPLEFGNGVTFDKSTKTTMMGDGATIEK